MHLIDLAALSPVEWEHACQMLGNPRGIKRVHLPQPHLPGYNRELRRSGLYIALRWEEPHLDREVQRIHIVRGLTKPWCLVLFIDWAYPLLLHSSELTASEIPIGYLHLIWPEVEAVDLVIQAQADPALPLVPVAVSIGAYTFIQQINPT